MKTRPILMSGEMVRAILDGRKTQTRRVIKLQPIYTAHDGELAFADKFCHPHFNEKRGIKCPHGKPGDLLWVKETHAFISPDEFCRPALDCRIQYRADTTDKYPGQWPEEEARGNPEAPKWRPSIHMPRWASRITLLIKDIRVERLQNISLEDIRAEGLDSMGCNDALPKSWKILWNSLNKKPETSWESSPWVWVIEFEPIFKNVDEIK